MCLSLNDPDRTGPDQLQNSRVTSLGYFRPSRMSFGKKILAHISFNKILTNKICNLTAAQPALHTYFVFGHNKCSLR